MRPICSLMLACFFIAAYDSAAQGQGTANVFVYSDIAFGIGEPWGFRATANCLFLRHHEIGLGYNSYWHRGPEVPDGTEYYNSSYTAITTYPQETISGAALTYAYVFYPKKKPDQLRYLLRAGLLLGRRSAPYNFHELNALSKTWEFDYSEEPVTAFIFQPTINVTPTKAFGMTAGAYLLLQEHISGGGIFMGLQIGKVGNHFRYQAAEKRAAWRARLAKRRLRLKEKA